MNTTYYKIIPRHIAMSGRFEVGKTYEYVGELSPNNDCYYCYENPIQHIEYYNGPVNLFEVEIGSEFISHRDGVLTNKMKLIREITGEEKNSLLSGTIHDDSLGIKKSYVSGLLHSEDDQPAIIWYDSDCPDRIKAQYWYKHGERHREGDNPAVILADGTREWHKNGMLCREGDQPAVIMGDGNEFWYKKGLLHRDGDKPAIIRKDGSCKWYQNGTLHRAGGRPAIIYANGTKKYYINGRPTFFQ